MRWEQLFADLEGTVESLERQERDADISERTRAAQHALTWADRIAGASIVLHVESLGPLEGVVDTITGGWLLLRTSGTYDWVVATEAVVGVSAAPAGVGQPQPHGSVARRMTWVHAFSVLSRDRAQVQVVRRGAGAVSGMPVVVGKDHVELWAAEPTEGDRSARRQLVPYAAIVAVRCPR